MDGMLIAAGALTGFLVGLTGVGGGALMTPILLLIFGMPPPVAVGTDLWFAAITKIFATRVHQRKRLIDWSVAKLLWVGSLTSSAATLIGIKLYTVDINSNANFILSTAIASAVMLTGLAMLFQKQLYALGLKLRLTDGERFKTMQAPLTILAGAVLGVLVTLTSVGAGALGAMFLTYLYPLRLTPPRLIATDIVHAIPLAIFAGLGHFLTGNVNFVLLSNLLLGSIPAVIVGAMLSSRLPYSILRGALAVVLFALALKMLWSIGG
jgi:hypothetical protein